MLNLEIARQRLTQQYIASAAFEKAVEVVRWFGAMQAQDYLGALWAVGSRMQNAMAEDVERAIAAGEIVRTHPMRGTWHFVAGDDIRWLLSLTGQRMLTRTAPMYRQLELDNATFACSHDLIERMLQGGKQLTRHELAAAHEQVGISTTGLRLTFLLSHAELEGLIVGGVRRGKQFTLALLDEMVPTYRMLEREEALAELARRYFTSHGPATAHDFAWWSGLTLAEVRTGLALNKEHLVEEKINGQSYWRSPSLPTLSLVSPTAYVLPPYDEYTVAYKDRSAVLDPAHIITTRNGIFSPIIVVNGQVVGLWAREVKKSEVIVTPNLFVELNKTEMRAVVEAAERYGKFLGLPVTVA